MYKLHVYSTHHHYQYNNQLLLELSLLHIIAVKKHIIIYKLYLYDIHLYIYLTQIILLKIYMSRAGGNDSVTF